MLYILKWLSIIVIVIVIVTAEHAAIDTHILYSSDSTNKVYIYYINNISSSPQQFLFAVVLVATRLTVLVLICYLPLACCLLDVQFLLFLLLYRS